MKDNSKNRKLEFIRIKNGIRSGQLPVHSSCKINPEIIKDELMYHAIKMNQAMIGWLQIKKKFKLKIGLPEWQADYGTERTDFLQNLITLRIIYKV